jgi:murein DD-endopeptidase MepM/ murein hydrolase activator NlpD
MKGKFYTVMIVPHTRARFSRFKVSASFVLILSFIALITIVSTGLLPIYMHLSRAKAAEVRELKQENRELRAAGQEVDQNLAALRERVAFFETKATKFAMMAGMQDLPSAQPVGGLRETAMDGAMPRPASRSKSAVNGTLLREEMQTLEERSGVLKESFGILEKVYRDQSLLLASTPSIAPVHGMIAYGFQWRRDPFTGQRAFHSGLDIVANSGTKVLAPADGVVTAVMRDAGYGNVIYISHGNDVQTRYGHLSGFAVRVGQEVQRGEVIGYVGNTGRSLGSHLHYEVLVQGTKVDPINYILDDDQIS